MPFQGLWQLETCILNVQHASPPRAEGTGGRMQQQWSHQQHITGFGLAQHLRMCFTAAPDIFRTQPSQPMRAGQYSQGTVACIGIIQVQPHGQHLLQQLHRWLYMRHTFLHTPGPKSSHLDLLFESKCQILVPCHKPVGFRTFVKVDAANRNGAKGKIRTHQICQQ